MVACNSGNVAYCSIHIMLDGDLHLVLGRHLQSPHDAPAVAPVVAGPRPGPLLLLAAAQDGLQPRAEADTLQLLLGQAEVVVQRQRAAQPVYSVKSRSFTLISEVVYQDLRMSICCFAVSLFSLE